MCVSRRGNHLTLSADDNERRYLYFDSAPQPVDATEKITVALCSRKDVTLLANGSRFEKLEPNVSWCAGERSFVGASPASSCPLQD